MNTSIHLRNNLPVRAQASTNARSGHVVLDFFSFFFVSRQKRKPPVGNTANPRADILIIILAAAFFSTCNPARAQPYATLDVFAAHRTQPIQTKTGTVTSDANTAGVTATAGYLVTLLANEKILQLYIEETTRVPLDQTNAVTTGIRAGFVIPAGNFRLMPALGAYTTIQAATNKPFTLGPSIKIVYAAKDWNWYIEPSHINHFAAISIGCILTENALFKQ